MTYSKEKELVDICKGEHLMAVNKHNSRKYRIDVTKVKGLVIWATFIVDYTIRIGAFDFGTFKFYTTGSIEDYEIF